MRVIKAYTEILNKNEIKGIDVLKKIEIVGRTCYKSENLISEESSLGFVERIINRGHEAMIEHYSISVRFICDRGVSHELVRHRIASFAQESTRYCNYSKDKFGNELTFIKPCFLDENSEKYNEWKTTMEFIEKKYFKMLELGLTPQESRSVLPNSLKTEIVMTANIREWRSFFKLRVDKAAHPQMRELTIPLLKEMKETIPVVFDDIYDKFKNEGVYNE